MLGVWTLREWWYPFGLPIQLLLPVDAEVGPLEGKAAVARPLQRELLVGWTSEDTLVRHDPVGGGVSMRHDDTDSVSSEHMAPAPAVAPNRPDILGSGKYHTRPAGIESAAVDWRDLQIKVVVLPSKASC